MKKIYFDAIRLCIIGVMVSIVQIQTVAADTPPPPIATTIEQTAKTDPEKPKILEVKTKKMDAAGEKLGAQMEAFSEHSGGKVGKWINKKVVAGISWLKLIITFSLLFLVVFIERVTRMILQRKSLEMESPAGGLDSEKPVRMTVLTLRSLKRPLSLFIWANGVYLAVTPLFSHFRNAQGDNLVQAIFQKGTDVAVAISILWFVINMVSLIDQRLRTWAAGTESTIDDMLAPLVGKTFRVFILLIGGILIMQNLTGIKIGPLLASLGVGGLAVALAAKDSIANFFGTLTILFDKPFQVGHRVLIDGVDGTIEDVGFRSTQIRTLTGHLVTIPNEKLVNTPIENIGARPFLRWNTNLTITYDTPPAKVERAVRILEEILANHEGLKPSLPPRVFFNAFNDCSLNIQVLAWYHPANYWDYAAWLQKICLEILRRFEAEGIEFAFPTSTLYLAGDEKRRLALRILQNESEKKLV